MEACKQYTSAIAALQYCLALLTARSQEGPEGFASLGLAGFSQGTQSSAYRVLLLQHLGLEGSSDGMVTPENVTTALQTSLARNFCLAGRHQEAVDLFGQLESQGSLRPGSPCFNMHSLLCYGYAAQQLGQTDLASQVLERAVAEAVDDLDRVHAVTAVLQVGRYKDTCCSMSAGSTCRYMSDFDSASCRMCCLVALGRSETSVALCT